MKTSDTTRIDALIEVPGIARTTFTATPDRIFYDLATEDTIDSGSIPFNADDFHKLVSVITDNRTETPLPTDLRSEIYLGENRIIPSAEKLKRIIDFLTDTSSHLDFMRGFR